PKAGRVNQKGLANAIGKPVRKQQADSQPEELPKPKGDDQQGDQPKRSPSPNKLGELPTATPFDLSYALDLGGNPSASLFVNAVHSGH
ncbi:MAG TPA: hypothetical protein VFI31_07390, partial [Pirellulales bacterium]|nr:hypothetical protein [Pirellulales bacterium]